MSGYGVYTRQGRCFPFWTEILKCYEDSPFPPKDCKKYAEDYIECLHHFKEVNDHFNNSLQLIEIEIESY